MPGAVGPKTLATYAAIKATYERSELCTARPAGFL